MKSKKWIFVLCNFLASFFLVACQSGSNGSQSAVEAIKQKGKLVVATSPDYAPFEFQSLVDGKNQVVGADIDMAQAIADELGVKLEISSMSFDNVLTSLQTGKADLAVAGISATDETVALLSKLDVDKHIDVEIKLDELDLTSAESKASYAQIKEYILEKFDLKVSTLYIAQIKKKCGIVLREHYNKSKKEKQLIPQCTPEKEEAIIDALRHFKMI